MLGAQPFLAYVLMTLGLVLIAAIPLVLARRPHGAALSGPAAGFVWSLASYGWLEWRSSEELSAHLHLQPGPGPVVTAVGFLVLGGGVLSTRIE